MKNLIHISLKRKKFIKKLSYIFLILICIGLLSSFLATTVLAETATTRDVKPELNVEIPGVNLETVTLQDNTAVDIPWIGQYISGIYKYLISIVATLASVVIMYGGFLRVTAAGNRSKIDDSNAWILAAISGLFLSLSAYTILYYINPNLVNFKPISVTKVMDVEVQYSGGLSYQVESGRMTLAQAFSTEPGKDNIPTDHQKWDTELATAASEYGIDCKLLKSFMYAESAGNPNAQSGVGARGLIQVMPDTAKYLGVDYNKLFDPAVATKAGAKYINILMKTACNGKTSRPESGCTVSDLTYVIAAYNAGPGRNKEAPNCPGQAIWQCNGFKETKGYVPKVLANYQKLQSLGGSGC